MSRDLFSQLPEDLVVQIFSYAAIHDVIAAKQTCRSLYSMTGSDYLWHRLLPCEELPLKIPPSVDLRNFSADELQAAAIQALKLRANWSSENAQIHGLHLANAKYNGSFDELKLLNGATTLLGIRRERHLQRPTMIVCVYTLVNIENPYMTAQLFVTATMKDFDACLADEGNMLILAATVTKDGTEMLQAYRCDLPLDNPTICNNTYTTPYSFALLGEGLLHKVSLHGDFIATSVMDRYSDEGGRTPGVLIANWKTKYQITVFPRFTENVEQIIVKVLPPYVAIVAATVSKVEVILVPLNVIALGGLLESPIVSKTKEKIIPDYPSIVVPSMDFYDICASDNMNYGPFVPPTSLSLIAFPSLSRLEMRQNKKAVHIRFSINAKAVAGDSGTAGANDIPTFALDVSAPFDVPVGSYPEHACLGTTGRRAVWLEQSLKSDYVRVLRLDHDPSSGGFPSVNVLLPPEPQLPFKPSSCRALAFDEATGRLCVGLYNGSVYILDYA